MIAEVTITLSDWVIEQIGGVAILFSGLIMGYIWRDQEVFSEIRSMIRRRRAQRAAR